MHTQHLFLEIQPRGTAYELKAGTLIPLSKVRYNKLYFGEKDTDWSVFWSAFFKAYKEN